MSAIKKILVGIDGSERSYRAASYAADLAATYGAKVTLMFVASSIIYYNRFDKEPIIVPDTDIDRIFDPARRSMEEKGVAFDTVVETGDPAIMLVDRSKDGYDLVVVGAKGVTRLHGLVIGSVSSHTVNHSEVPVLVVH